MWTHLRISRRTEIVEGFQLWHRMTCGPNFVIPRVLGVEKLIRKFSARNSLEILILRGCASKTDFGECG